MQCALVYVKMAVKTSYVCACVYFDCCYSLLCFGVNTLKELFENVESRNIVAFIKDINFYHCI